MKSCSNRRVDALTKELMQLISEHAQMHRASFMGSAKECSEYRSEADKTRRKIERLIHQAFSLLDKAKYAIEAIDGTSIENEEIVDEYKAVMRETK